jgi:molecular chaperone DnaK (HSP70)
MQKIVSRNTPVPTRKSLGVSTAIDNQDTMQIRVFAGERTFTKDNVFLGSVDLDQIAPAAAGAPRIYISFEVDVHLT